MPLPVREAVMQAETESVGTGVVASGLELQLGVEERLATPEVATGLPEAVRAAEVALGLRDCVRLPVRETVPEAEVLPQADTVRDVTAEVGRALRVKQALELAHWVTDTVPVLKWVVTKGEAVTEAEEDRLSDAVPEAEEAGLLAIAVPLDVTQNDSLRAAVVATDEPDGEGKGEVEDWLK